MVISLFSYDVDVGANADAAADVVVGRALEPTLPRILHPVCLPF